MATVGVTAIGTASGGNLDDYCFKQINFNASSNGQIDRSIPLTGLPASVIVLVDQLDLVPHGTGNPWLVVIPKDTLVVVVTVGAGNVPKLNIAETAQPIQVSGPTIPILDFEV